MISWENYEEYIIMYADGELPAAEEQELMAFLNSHPELKKELSVYEITRLAPDETIVYGGKNALLKQAPATRVILFPTWVKYGIAAGIAAILFVTFFKYWNTGNDINTIVKNDTATHSSPVQTSNVPVENVTAQNTQAAKQPVTTVAQAPARHKQPGTTNNKIVREKREAIAAVDNNTPVAQQPDKMNTLPVAGTRSLPCSNAGAALAQVDAPELPAPIEQQEARRTFWEWLPMEQEKKSRMENIAGVVASAFGESDHKKEEPAEKKVNLRVENRKLKLTF